MYLFKLFLREHC